MGLGLLFQPKLRGPWLFPFAVFNSPHGILDVAKPIRALERICRVIFHPLLKLQQS
jgi:hypothetical protein